MERLRKQEDQNKKRYGNRSRNWTDAGMGPGPKKCRQPLRAGQGMQPCQYLDISSVEPISDFLPTDNKCEMY